MENQTHNVEILTQEQMIKEIHQDMRKAKAYAKWQLIITVALVVLPLLAALIVIPLALSSLTSLYSGTLIQ